jgi:hypothetical protein
MLLVAQEEMTRTLRRLPQRQTLSSAAASSAQSEAYRAWSTFIVDFTDMMKRAVKQATALPFGSLALYHEQLVVPTMATAEEAAASPFALNPMYDEAVQAALTKRYRDGLALSERIWLLDQRGRNQIGAILLRGVQEQHPINQVALGLQQHVGANQGCRQQVKRWLGFQTNRALLSISGGTCGASGISWQAVRLAQNESIVAMNLANDMLLARMPWVEAEKINLAATHGDPDECDEVASGGEKGDGVYPLGSVELPLHPLCKCHKEAVVADRAEFGKRVGRFAKRAPDPDLLRYQRVIGGVLGASLLAVPIAKALGVWYGGDQQALDDRFWAQDAEEPLAEAVV